jgi:PmbA protein
MSEEILREVSQIAKNLGVENFDILMSKNKNFSLKASNQKIDEYKLSSSQSIGIRLINKNKLGLAYTEDLSKESLKWMVKNALIATDFTDADENENISSVSENFVGETFKLDEVPTEEKIQLALKLESEVKKRDSRVVTTPYNGYTESEGQKFLLNSKGVFSAESIASYSIYTSAFMKEGDKSSLMYLPSVAKKFHELDLNSCVDYCVKSASDLLDAKTIPSGKYDVIFDTEILKELWDFFYGVFSGKKAKEKMNPWGEKLGQTVTHEKLNLIDDPFYKKALFHSFVDDEGIKRKPLTLLKNGRLENFMHNSNSAKYFKTQPTGHSSRSTSSPLAVSATHFVFSVGPDSENEIYKGKVLKIIDQQGLHPGSNAISGDFSFGIKGYVMEDGKKTAAFNGITIAGNFFEMMKSELLVGKLIETDPTHSFFSPVMRFKNLNIAGV